MKQPIKCIKNTHLFVLLQATGLLFQTLHHLLQFFLLFDLLLLHLLFSSCCISNGLFTAGWNTTHLLQLKYKPQKLTITKKQVMFK